MGMLGLNTPWGIIDVMHSRAIRSAVVAGLAALAALALAACAPEESSADGATASAGPAAAADAAALPFDGTHVDSADFAVAADAEGVTVIDVRTPAEFAEGHLPGAVNIDVSDPAFGDAVAELEVDGAYAVYCRSGNRSRVAIDQMATAGIASTVGLEGGIGAWHGDVVAG